MTNQAVKKYKKTRKRFSLADVIIYLLLTLFALLCLAPFLYVISVSFTDPAVYVPNQFSLIPKKFSLKVYATILQTKDFMVALKNSLIVTAASTFLGVFTTFGLGYGLTKKELPGRKLIMGMVIFALLFDCGLIPNYMNIRNLGILNTYWALIIPSLATAYNVVIVKTFLFGHSGRAGGGGDHRRRQHLHHLLPDHPAAFAGVAGDHRAVHGGGHLEHVRQARHVHLVQLHAHPSGLH